jgi:hypothetical protein
LLHEIDGEGALIDISDRCLAAVATCIPDAQT